MLSIKEICAQTGITPQTFQSWRRDGLKLLPKPVAVKKNFIYFDDSILERVQFIRDQRAAGKKLGEIEAIFTSYYGFVKSWENNDPETISLRGVIKKLAADNAALKSRLANLHAAFVRDLDSYEERIQRLFRDFQAALTEGGLSAFLSALSANRIGFIDQTRPAENFNTREAKVHNGVDASGLTEQPRFDEMPNQKVEAVDRADAESGEGGA